MLTGNMDICKFKKQSIFLIRFATEKHQEQNIPASCIYTAEKRALKKKNHQNLNSLQIRQKLNTNFGTAFNSPLKYRVLAEKKKQQQKTCLLVTESYDYWKFKISGETTKLYQLTITTLGPQKHNWEQNIVTWMLEDEQMNKSLFTNQ